MKKSKEGKPASEVFVGLAIILMAIVAGIGFVIGCLWIGFTNIFRKKKRRM